MFPLTAKVEKKLLSIIAMIYETEVKINKWDSLHAAASALNIRNSTLVSPSWCICSDKVTHIH